MNSLLRASTVALLITGLTAPALAEQTSLRRFALIAGSNDGGPGRVRLRYAATDAIAMAKVLEELGGVPSSDTILLVDPDREEFEIGVALLQQKLEAAAGPYRRIEALVYYSGHSDEQGLLLDGELLPYKHFRGLLDGLGADVRIAVLDSCASGALTRSKGGRRHAPFMIDVSQRVKGHAFLTSASATEAAQESDRVGGSFFTHYLVSGLRGAADVTGDRRVTLTEAYQFAFNETLARTENTQSGPQHPNYDIQLAGSGDVVMTDLHQTSAVMVFPDQLRGRLFVRDDSGRLVAELLKSGGRTVEIGLEPGRYLVTVDDGATLQRGLVSLRKGERSEVNHLEMVAVEREQVVARGNPGSYVRESMELDDLDYAPPRPPAAVEPEQDDDDEREPDAEIDPDAVVNPKQYSDVNFSLTVVPGVGTDFFVKGKSRKRWSLNVLYGRTDLLHGVELGTINHTLDGMTGAQIGVVNLNDGFLNGVQIGNPLNVTAGGGSGLQLSTGANIMDGRFSGAQVSTGANIMRSTRPTAAQIGVGFNFAAGGLSGTQISAGANLLEGRGSAVLQATAGANIASNKLTGAQLSAGFNYAYELQGIQLNSGINIATQFSGAQIGLLNISGDSTGAQIGLLNIAAGNVSGTQIGLVNISGEYDSGGPIGLLSFVKNGQLHLDVWASDSFYFNTSLKFGSKNVYTIFTAAASPGEGPDRLGRAALGIGIGGTLYPTDNLFFSLDGSFYEADMKVPEIGKVRMFVRSKPENLVQARLMVGYKFYEHLGIFAGISGNVYVGRNGKDMPYLSNVADRIQTVTGNPERGVTTRVWPGFFAGVQL